MLFNLSFILLGFAGLSAALPVPVLDASIVASRHIEQDNAEIQVLSKREADTVNQVVQEEVIVYLDGAGKPVSTTTVLGTPATVPTPASHVQSNQLSQQSAPASTPVSTPAASSDTQNTPSQGNNKLGAASLAGSPFQKGVTYTPKFGSGACKSAAQVQTDISFLVSKGYDLVRIYDTSCDGPKNLQAALKGTSTWMFLGIYDIDQAASEASDMANQLGNDWSQVHTVSVGNEVVQNGGNPGAVVAAIGTARSALRGLGYNGPVVTVDTAVVVEVNPELCQKSDYCAVNCHAFWDGNPASEASGTINFHVQALKEKTGMDKVVITESGWPTCGTGDGAAVASPAAQAAAIGSLESVTVADIIYFSGFNELWKQNFAGSLGGEQCWGIFGDAPSGA